MLTGDVRSQIDAIWNAFWTGGISNPLEVIEQITYLLFIRRLDDLNTLPRTKPSAPAKPRAFCSGPVSRTCAGRCSRTPNPP